MRISTELVVYIIDLHYELRKQLYFCTKLSASVNSSAVTENHSTHYRIKVMYTHVHADGSE